jgi:hypothetical protein
MNERYDFDLVHRLEPHENQNRNTPWFERFALGDEDVVQLLEAVLRPLDPTLTDEKLRTGNAADIFCGELEGFDLSPIECWDVVDRHEAVLYQLWLFDPSHGVLLEAGTTNAIGVVEWHRFGVYSEKIESMSEAAFLEGLRHGQTTVRKKHPKSELASIRF